MKKIIILLFCFLFSFQNADSQCLGGVQPLTDSWQSVDPPTFRFQVSCGPCDGCGGVFFCINVGSVCPPLFPISCNWHTFLFGMHDSCYTVPNSLWNQFIVDTQYHWLSKVMNNGASQWQNCVGPIVRLYASLPPANLVYPNSGGISLTSLFKWDTVATATNYRLRIYSTQGLSVIVLDTVLTRDSMHVPTGKLNYNCYYWWSVKPYKAGGEGPYADVYSFCTLMTGIIVLNSSVPENFFLYQNYPNPFNPTTKIKFDVPNMVGVAYMRPVQLRVYDVLGREVATLVNEQLNPGSYETEWPATGGASNYPSGVYFYKLEVHQTDGGSLRGDFSQTKKLVLIK